MIFMAVPLKEVRSVERASTHLLRVLGPAAVSENWEEAGLPEFVFRVMSEEHFQISLQEGFHISDERANYIGQKAANPEFWEGEEPEAEGTVAGRYAYLGYLSKSPNGVGRVVKIQVHPDDDWEVHPDDDEGGYIRAFQPIPVNRFVAWTDPIDPETWTTVLHPLN